MYNVGPDQTFTGLPHSLWVVCVADGVFGLASGFFNLCPIGEYSDNIRARYPNVNEDVTGMASCSIFLGYN
jgi:hypothetical protein